MAISPVAASAAASTAQANARIAQAQAQSSDQQALIDAKNAQKETNPVNESPPPAKATVNTNGVTIGTTINAIA